jgi:Mn2+/Fe2+ NRAMP family transporter
VLAIALSILAFQLFGSYKTIATVFKWMAMALLTYVATAFFVKIDYTQVLRATLIPSLQFNGHFLSMVVAILGTTISPYLFFWQADQEVEEKIQNGKRGLWRRRGTDEGALKARALDIKTGMLFANLVMFFIMLVTGSTLFPAGVHEIATSTEAAAALRPLAGPFASVLFAAGIIGSGFLAVPVLTSSGAYALSQAFGMKHGLHQRVERAKGFYTIIVLSTVFGLIISCVGINPMKALFFSAVVNGVLAPPLLVLIMLIANSKKIMGEDRIDPVHNILGWTATALMFIAACGMFMVHG